MDIFKNKKIRLLIGILIFLPFLYYSGIDAVKNTIKANILYIASSFSLTLIVYFLDSIRWGYITNSLRKTKDISYIQYFIIYLKSVGLGQFISQTGGLILFRPFFLKKKAKIEYKTSLIAIYFEKVADLYYLLIILINTVFFLSIKNIKIIMITIPFSLFIGNLIYTNIAEKLELFSIKILSKFSSIKSKISKYNNKNSESYNFNKPRSYLFISIITIVRFLMLSLRLFFLVLALNINISFFLILLGIPVSQLSLLFAFTPGAMGILEGGWLGFLTISNISKDIIGDFLIGQRFYWIVFSILFLIIAGIINIIVKNKKQNKGNLTF